MTTSAQDPSNPIYLLSDVESSKVADGLRFLDVAIGQYCALPAADPETKACLKLARDAINDMFLGMPVGFDQAGNLMPNRPTLFVARDDLGFNGYAQAEVIDADETSATEEVGVGNEIVVLSGGAVNSPPWWMCSVLAHEGKRCVNSYIDVDAGPLDTVTPEEGKEFNRNLADTYYVNVASLDGALVALQNIADGYEDGSETKDTLNSQIADLTERRDLMQSRLDDALASVAALCQ